MVGVAEEKINRLIDRISKLTIALENMPIGNEGHARNDMFPFWRRSNRFDDESSLRWEDLDYEKKSEYEKKQQNILENYDKMLETMSEKMEEKQKEVDKRVEEINNEKNDINNKLNNPSLLLNEISEHHRRIRELNDEEVRLREEINKEAAKEEEIREKRNKISSQNTEEFYNSQKSDAEPKRGSREAFDKSKTANEEFGDYESYKNFEERRKNTAERVNASKKLYEYNMGNTAFGKYAQGHLNLNQRIDDYANFGQILKGSYGKQLASATFGNGKIGGVATKAFSKLGSVVTKVAGTFSKLYPVIGIVIDVLKFANKVATEHFKHQAKLTEIQRKSEEIQYNRDKELTLKEQELKIENINYTADLNKKVQEVYSQNMLQAVGIENQSYLAGHAARIGTMMNGITDTAYAAAESNIDIATQIEKFDVERDVREKEKEMFEQSRGLKNEAKRNIVEAQKQEIYAKTNAELRMQNQDLKEYTHQTGLDIGGLVKTIEGFSADGKAISPVYNENQSGGLTDKTTTTGNTPNPFNGEGYKVTKVSRLEAAKGIAANSIGKLVNADETLKASDEYNRKVMELENQRSVNEKEMQRIRTENEFELQQTKVDNENEIKTKALQNNAEVTKAQLDTAAALKKQYLQLAKFFENTMEKTQTTSNSLAIGMGHTGAGSVRQFEVLYNQLGKEVFSKWGKSAEEAAALQNSYAENTGRNIRLGGKDYDKLFGVGKLIGDEGVAAELASNLEIFNHSASDSMDMIEKSMQNVSKYGLNARKYSKDLLKNLQLANKYNFKGGTRGLMDMAKWAQMTRFNMDSLGGMIDKVQQGGIEGVITQAAGFQVLGGQAAMNSNPLGMLYDAFADPAAYAKRMQDMTKGFGRFNEKTGETEFNINETMQINQLAKLQGRSAEELRKEIMDRNKRSRIENILNPNFNEQQKALVGSKAHYNENGEWVVTMDNNEEKRVSELSASDLESLMPETHDEAVEDYMKKLLTAVEKLQGDKLYQQFDVMTEKWNEWLDEVDKRINESQKDYFLNRDENLNNISEGMKAVTASFANMKDIANKGNAAIDEATGKISEAANNIGDELSNVAMIISAAKEEMNRLLDKPLKLSPNANENYSKGSGNPEFNDKLKKIDRSGANDWLNSSVGKEWGDDHYVKNAMGIMESLSGNKVDIRKLATNYTDISGIDLFEEDGYRKADSPKEILENFRELFLQGKINEKGEKIENGEEVNLDKYFASEFGKQLENAIKNAINFREVTYDSADNEGELVALLKSIGKRENYQGPEMVGEDTITRGNGSPMMIKASEVTPIQDGTATIAQTDPYDTAIFAKPDGPFDKLFTGIFGKISEIYDVLIKPMQNKQQGLSNTYISSNIYNSSKSQLSNVYTGSTSIVSSQLDNLYNYFSEAENREVYIRNIEERIGKLNTKVESIKGGYSKTDNISSYRNANYNSGTVVNNSYGDNSINSYDTGYYNNSSSVRNRYGNNSINSYDTGYYNNSSSVRNGYWYRTITDIIKENYSNRFYRNSSITDNNYDGRSISSISSTVNGYRGGDTSNVSSFDDVQNYSSSSSTNNMFGGNVNSVTSLTNSILSNVLTKFAGNTAKSILSMTSAFNPVSNIFNRTLSGVNVNDLSTGSVGYNISNIIGDRHIMSKVYDNYNSVSDNRITELYKSFTEPVSVRMNLRGNKGRKNISVIPEYRGGNVTNIGYGGNTYGDIIRTLAFDSNTDNYSSVSPAYNDFEDNTRNTYKRFSPVNNRYVNGNIRSTYDKYLTSKSSSVINNNYGDNLLRSISTVSDSDNIYGNSVSSIFGGDSSVVSAFENMQNSNTSSSVNNRYTGGNVRSVLGNYLTNMMYESFTAGNSSSSISNFSDSDLTIKEKPLAQQVIKSNGNTIEGLNGGVITRENNISPAPEKEKIQTIMPSTSPVGELASVVSGNTGGNEGGILSPKDFNLTINGKIELTGQNGQSVDIMETLKNNPMFIRKITEMIVVQLNNNTYGGRNELFPKRFSS